LAVKKVAARKEPIQGDQIGVRKILRRCEMSWIIRLLSKASKTNMTDVMNQQFTDDIIHILKELI
jgi:hypothetical protein